MSIDKYQNREDAGNILAQYLLEYADRDDVFILALPRGGVPVAYQIAKVLRAPFDVFIVRKLGVPSHSELAMGAIATGNVCIFNDDIIQQLGISQADIAVVIEKEQQELKRRELVYRDDRPFPVVKDKTIILVDDGIATGATMRAAIQALRKLQPAQLIVAVPVADAQMCEQLRSQVDKLVCPLQPTQLYAVGAWYHDFSQTEDEEVFRLLKEVEKS